MFCKLLALIFFVSIWSSNAFLFSSPSWDDFKITFGINPFSSKYFVRHPRTVPDSNKKFVLDSTVNGCNGPKNGFLGHRYVNRNGDRSIMLLFDSQGVIAGIQTRVPKSVTGYPTQRNFNYHNVWVNDTDSSHTLTAYFVDPAIICNAGRNKTALKKEGTGNRIAFQIGRPNSNSQVKIMNIPLKESDIGSTKWTKGKCFVGMGQHYWYNMRMDMDCDDFFPAFLLYNSGKLDGFGFAMAANFEGERFEHPTVSVAKSFFPFVPKCMYEPGFPSTFSTVHIYMYKRPWTKLCL